MKSQDTFTIESESGFKALFQFATVGIIVVNDQGAIELVNPNAEKLFGYLNYELIGQNIEILIPDALKNKHISHRVDYFKNPKARAMGYGLELYARKKDGQNFPVEISLGHYRFDNKNLAVAFITDNTIRRENEERYKNIFDNSLVAMFEMDTSTRRIINTNEMGAKLFGYNSISELIEKFDPQNHYINMNDRHDTFRSVMKNMESETVKEQEMKRVDGSRFWAKLFVKLNHDNKISQAVVLDISDTKRTQEELEKIVEERTIQLSNSLQKEKDLNEMKSRFVSMASHEFRTPLTAILSSATLIQLYQENGQVDKGIKHIERIKSSVKNLVDILNDFLSLEKLEQGVVQIERKIFNLNNLLVDLREETNTLLKKGQFITLHYDGGSEIRSDEKIIRNVIINLISNAIKYSNENDEIQIHAESNQEKVTFSVQDKGIGIPEEEQKNMFTKFYRAKNTGTIQGTGLGLTIVKRYVDLLNGEISFTSTSDTGTTFKVTFPT